MYKYSEAVVKLGRVEERLKNQTSWKLEEEKHTHKETVKWYLLYCIILYLYEWMLVSIKICKCIHVSHVIS